MNYIEKFIEETIEHLEDLSSKLESNNYDEMLTIANQAVLAILIMSRELKKEKEKHDRK